MRNKISADTMKIPEWNKDNDEEMSNEAIRLRDSGNKEEALDILLKINARSPEIFGVYILIGDLLGQMSKHSESIEYLQHAVMLRPDLSITSLGYFHALWNLGRFRDAIFEAVRFDNANGTTEYVEILNDYDRLNFEGFQLNPQELSLIRSQLHRYPSSYRRPYEDSFDFDGQGGTGK